MFTLLIDYREKSVIEIFQEGFGIHTATDVESIVNINGEFCKVVIKNLPVADFVYQKDGQDILYIERKTKSDLISSIIDGRFREQKSRLNQCENPVLYFIESPGQILKRAKPSEHIQKIYYSSILNMQFNHGFKVIVPLNAQESFEILVLLFSKLKNKDFLTTTPSTESKVAIVRPKTKAQSIHENLFLHQLCLIKGVSVTIGEQITKVYGCAGSLCSAYLELTNETEKEDLLSSIQTTDKRKVGKALSKRIYHSIMGQNKDQLSAETSSGTH